MYCVTVKDNHYNELAFMFEALEDAMYLIRMAADEGYNAIVSVAQQEAEAE